MRKIAWLLVVVLVTGLLLIGCAKSGSGGSDRPATSPAKTDKPQEETKKGETPPKGSTATDSYTRYLEAKNEMMTRLTEAVNAQPEAAMAAFSFFKLTMVDLAMLPAAFIGQDETAAAAGMAFFGIEGVRLEHSGDSASLIYKNQAGEESVFTGRYDPRADWYTFTLVVDGKENLYAEYRGTSYGYVAQYFLTNDDGTTTLMRVTIEGKDGSIGLEDGGSRPAPLTGNENPDFPMKMPEWYAVKGNAFKGLMSDGTELDFTLP